MPRITVNRREITGIDGLVDVIVQRNGRRFYIQDVVAIYYRADGNVTVRSRTEPTFRNGDFIHKVVPAITWRDTYISVDASHRVRLAVSADQQEWQKV